MAKNYQRLWEEVARGIDEAKSVRTLAEIVVDKEGRAFVSRLERKDAELCIEILDHGIAEHNLKTAEKQAFFVTLRRLSGFYGRLPDSMIITDKIEVDDKILASGGFADVRCGTYMGELVAVKTIRIDVAALDDPRKIRKQFCKEVVLWSTLSHPNVLKLVGVHGDMGKGQFSTVSEWMAHGNIMQFIKNNHANRLDLLHGAAQGLEYLHGANLVHGDLKGANILMSNGTPPRACLADFGFMTVVLNPFHKLSCSADLEGGTKAFMSPELLVPSKFGIKDSIPTPEADVYAFALVTFQVLTGEFPFRGTRDTELGWSVVQGLRPAKPENASSIGLSDVLWNFVQRCWDGDLKLRPKVVEVVTHLGRAAADWDGLMPPCAPVENIVFDSEGPTSDTLEHCGIFPSSKADPESPTESQATSGLFSRSNTVSTGYSELSLEGPLAVVIKPFEEPQPEPRVPARPRSEEPDSGLHVPVVHPQPVPRVPMQPQLRVPRDDLHKVGIHSRPESWAALPPRSEDPHDDPHALETYTHLGQRFSPPPSKLPEKKRKGFRHFKSKLREFFGLRR